MAINPIKKQLLHIGTIELISLPDDQILSVPAKIDTGADISSIWASDIKMTGGKLVFNFFAPGSAYYRKDPIVTTAFRTTTVRNSFGHKEFRYKIKLRIKVGDYTLVRWFSLADRSRNNYPILLGKNFLKNKFVVDVARKYILSEGTTTNNVVVLGAQSPASAEFFKQVSALNKMPVNYECVGYDSLVYLLSGSDTCITNTHDKDADLATYNYAYFKTHAKNAEFAAACAEYLHFKGRPFIDREVAQNASTSKLSEYMKLSCYDLPIPESICAATKELVKKLDLIESRLGYPFVLKEISSNQGKNNYLVSSASEFKKILKGATENQTFIAQKYIANDGFYRIYTLGKDVGMAVWRDATGHDDPLKAHLNKPSGGANAHIIDLADVPGDVQDLALRAANCMDRQIAGVDLVEDKTTHKWYILEVNNAPQIRSGSFVTEKAGIIAEFFDKELNR